jgi:hypothetical protein
MATTSSLENTCPVSEHKPDRDITSYYWNFSSNSEPAGFLDPVVEGMIVFNPTELTEQEQRDSWRFISRICAGTPIHFTSLSFVRHARTNTFLNGVQLSNYKIENYGSGLHATSGYGVDLSPL